MEKALEGLGLGPVKLDVETVQDHGLSATRVRVRGGEDPTEGRGHGGDERAHSGPPHRTLLEILRMIRESGLPPRVVQDSVDVFERLGRAEAEVHGIPIEHVHFHEVGAFDSIVDIVGTCWGLHHLDVTRLESSPFVMGHGEVAMAHGVWPVPAPATVRLVRGHPVRFVNLEGETVTPTGAALVTTLARSVGTELSMRLTKVACGAGTRQWPDRPNVLRAFLGEDFSPELPEDTVEVLEAVIDDMTPQALARTQEALLESGALDVTVTPLLMKKGRPGFCLTVLAPLSEAGRLASRVFKESTTIGIRRRMERRWVLSRRVEEVVTTWGAVPVKVSKLPAQGLRVTPEFDSCAHLAKLHGVEVTRVVEEAKRLAEERLGA
jgi:hypothetical protein